MKFSNLVQVVFSSVFLLFTFACNDGNQSQVASTNTPKIPIEPIPFISPIIPIIIPIPSPTITPSPTVTPSPSPSPTVCPVGSYNENNTCLPNGTLTGTGSYFLITYSQDPTTGHQDVGANARIQFSKQPIAGEAFIINVVNPIPAYSSNFSTPQTFTFTTAPSVPGSTTYSTWADIGGPTVNQVTIGTTLSETLTNLANNIKFSLNPDGNNVAVVDNATSDGVNTVTLHIPNQYDLNGETPSSYQIAPIDSNENLYQTLGSMTSLDIDTTTLQVNTWAGGNVNGTGIAVNESDNDTGNNVSVFVNAENNDYSITGDLEVDVQSLASAFNGQLQSQIQQVNQNDDNNQTPEMPSWTITAVKNQILIQRNTPLDTSEDNAEFIGYGPSSAQSIMTSSDVLLSN
jgi:hypothetical protein